MTAFLNAPIDCELYVEQPKRFVIKGDSGENLVLKLKKSLYGLKQSGRIFVFKVPLKRIFRPLFYWLTPKKLLS